MVLQVDPEGVFLGGGVCLFFSRRHMSAGAVVSVPSYRSQECELFPAITGSERADDFFQQLRCDGCRIWTSAGWKYFLQFRLMIFMSLPVSTSLWKLIFQSRRECIPPFSKRSYVKYLWRREPYQVMYAHLLKDAKRFSRTFRTRRNRIAYFRSGIVRL